MKTLLIALALSILVFVSVVRSAEVDPAPCGAATADLIRHQNSHDLEGFLSVFAEDYESFQPLYPEKHFGGPGAVPSGRSIVRRNWTGVFQRYPDFKATVIGCTRTADGQVWLETRWQGAFRGAKACFDAPVVMVMQERDGKIASASLYTKDLADPAFNAAVARCARE